MVYSVRCISFLSFLTLLGKDPHECCSIHGLILEVVPFLSPLFPGLGHEWGLCPSSVLHCLFTSAAEDCTEEVSWVSDWTFLGSFKQCTMEWFAEAVTGLRIVRVRHIPPNFHSIIMILCYDLRTVVPNALQWFNYIDYMIYLVTLWNIESNLKHDKRIQLS